MLTKDGEVAKLTDFGIAKAIDDDEQVTLTSSFLGSPHYMSPEQITNPKDVDTRSDIYALGAVFYEMLTGKKAYDGASAKEILDAHFELEPPQITGTDPLVPVCNEVFQHTMAFAISDRYQTPREVVEFLAPHLDTQVQIKAPRFSRTSIRLVALLAGVFVITCALIIGILATSNRHKPPAATIPTPTATNNNSPDTGPQQNNESSEDTSPATNPDASQKTLPGGGSAGVGINGGGTGAGAAGSAGVVNNAESVVKKNR